MSFFHQSTFGRIFSPDDSSRNGSPNFRTKMPKIDLDPVSKVINSIFSPKSSIRSVCENCNAKFGFTKKKKICNLCKFEYCSSCFEKETYMGLSQGYSSICLKCRVFSRSPIRKEDLDKLKVKELKWYLRSRRISFQFAKEKSDLVDLILNSFGRSTSSTFFTNQPGPSRTSFDTASASSSRINEQQRSNNSSNSTSNNSSPIRNGATNSDNNSNNNSNGTIDSEWEFINDRFSSMNSNRNSNQNSNQNSNRSSNRSSNQNSNRSSNRSSNQNSNIQTPTNETSINIQQSNNQSNDLNIDEFINLETETSPRNEEINIDEINLTDDLSILNNLLNNERETNNNNRINDDLNINDIRLDNNLNNSRRTASTSRLVNSNLNINDNLSESTESLSNLKATFNIADLNSEDEIRKLSVRQLKLVLTRNYVNYKGCCEKDELQEKAIRLWNQIRQDNDLLKNDDNTNDSDLCKICMENVINCCFLDCGHLVSCIDCGKQLNECCVCRQYIVKAIRVFKG